MALTFGLTRSIRARCAAITSRADTCFWRIRRTSSTALEVAEIVCAWLHRLTLRPCAHWHSQRDRGHGLSEGAAADSVRHYGFLFGEERLVRLRYVTRLSTPRRAKRPRRGRPPARRSRARPLVAERRRALIQWSGYGRRKVPPDRRAPPGEPPFRSAAGVCRLRARARPEDLRRGRSATRRHSGRGLPPSSSGSRRGRRCSTGSRRTRSGSSAARSTRA